jgi:hypothetical protein
MPGFDKKGPLGEGPMTGRRVGKCTGNQTEDSDRPAGTRRSLRFRRSGARGIRFGGGRGFGGGRRQGLRSGETDETNQ